MIHLTAFLCPLVRRGQGTPGRRGASPPQAGRNAASGQRSTKGREREAEFEIRGIDNLVSLQLKSSDGIYRLNDEIEIGIRQVSPGKGKRVPIHIRAPSTYRVKDKKYF